MSKEEKKEVKQENKETKEENKEVKQENKETKEELTLNDLPGVGAATAEKLKESGYDNLISLAVASPGEIVQAAGLGESSARKLINFCRNHLDMGFETGDQLLKKREQIEKITTGSKAFDAIIGGGFETGSISETFGQFGSGKSQVAHVIAVTAQLPKEKGGCDGQAIFIDGESTFRPERIQQISKGYGLDPEKTLKKIHVARAFNSDHQMLLAEKAEEVIKKQGNIKLIIVDSLTSHFRADFSGRGQLADRQQKLNKHMHALMRLSTKYNLCIYVTNQVMAKPDTFFGDPTTAIGGNIVGHNSSTRIYLRKGKKGSRVAKLIDSPHLPDAEAAFMVTEEGLKDLE